MKHIIFPSHRTTAFVEKPFATAEPGPLQVRGRTLISLVSPGTEIARYVSDKFPFTPGYACIFQVEQVGSEVTDIAPGTVVFSSGKHGTHHEASRDSVIPVPENLPIETAVFARLMGVSLASLVTTFVRPPNGVLVTGLGPVGLLAAQIFSVCGYNVTSIEPSEERRKFAAVRGVGNIRASLTDGPDIKDKISLHLECSGHERAVLDGCNVLRKGGELSLIGVPWVRRSDLYAQELLHAIFYRYIHVRSGWEGQIPGVPANFQLNSKVEYYRQGMEWLAEGRIKVDGMASVYSPDQAQEVYDGLADLTLPTPTAIFDWRK